MSSYRYRESQCGDRTVPRSSYLHNGTSYTGKMVSLSWIRAQVVIMNGRSRFLRPSDSIFTPSINRLISSPPFVQQFLSPSFLTAPTSIFRYGTKSGNYHHIHHCISHACTHAYIKLTCEHTSVHTPISIHLSLSEYMQGYTRIPTYIHHPYMP